LREQVLAKKGAHLLRYASSRGDIELRKAIAAYLCDFRGANCHADQIVVVGGTQQAMLACALALINEGEVAWIEDPVFHQASVDCDARDPVLQRHLPRKLRQFLEYLDENHLAKVFFIRSTRTMGSDDLGHERIELSHQCASRLIVMLERSMNKRTCVSIIHVIESASTPVAMTATGPLWLQFWV
jgi:hypothetical protein